MPPHQNVFTIPSGTPFLFTLAEFVLNGGPSLGIADNPLDISRTTIYLPTRRAVRSLRSIFGEILGNNAFFLPTIRTLGDGDEEGIDPFMPLDANSDLLRTISPITRQIQLGRLVKKWVEIIGQQAREVFQDEDIVIPSSSAESLWLANKIAELIDQMETEEISWQNLKQIVPDKDEYAKWWQLTLDFLQIAMKSWPDHLAQIGACDPASFRRQLLDIRSAQLTKGSSDERIIAAGSTGSIPATARFLKAVSELPQGSLILPGLDTNLEPHVWDDIHGGDGLADVLGKSGSEDHPQFGLSRLLKSIGIKPAEIGILGKQETELDNRSILVSTALLPSEHTGNWRQQISDMGKEKLLSATKNISIIEAAAERQEALAIALILRDQVENPNVRAALVTPDRNLARRVAGELKRFSLNIDDSGGQSLASSTNAIFVRLLISVATSANTIEATTLAALVKHPFLNIKSATANNEQIGEVFEICLLRDVLQIPVCGEFASAAEMAQENAKIDYFLPPMVKQMDDNAWQELIDFCTGLDSGLLLLSEIPFDKELEIATLFEKIFTCVNTTTIDDEEKCALFDNEPGIELAVFFEEMSATASNEFLCRADELPSVFDALIAGKTYRQAGFTHPRISIFGPLEARLQPLDCVILGGLNEGNWPALHDNGPFLNRPMKTAMELATPERRTGLAAHDFEQLIGCENVFLTRSQRIDNAPSVPSRWLQRLATVVGGDISKGMKERGNKYLQWVDQIDQPHSFSPRAQRPCPTPQIKDRPTGLSVTEIETWIRDPYAIYAKHVLKLLPLGELGTRPEPPLRGTILHDAVADFVEQKIDPENTNALGKLLNLFTKHMQNNQLPQHLEAVWMPRFSEIAKDFIAYEINKKPEIKQSYCEIDGRITLANSGFKLRGRADRINVLYNGEVEIIDYKSGTMPSVKTAKNLSPQLALEGAMVVRGGFEAIGHAKPNLLEYVRLRARGEFKCEAVNTENQTAADLSETLLGELDKLVSAYQKPEQGYISRFAVEKSKNTAGAYDHLARVSEWSLGDDDDEDAGANY